jgi:hypothetical protein
MKLLLLFASLCASLGLAADPSDLQLFLLIGQSNMAGRGKVEPQDRAPIPRVFMLTKEMTWAPAVDPMHFDKPDIAGVGLGRSFATTLLTANPSVRIGLIPAAFGGTSLDQWKVGGDLYNDAIKRARQAMKAGKLRAILWHQGEADSGKEELVKSYRERFAAMMGRLRADLNAPEVPVVVGQLGEFYEGALAKPLNEQLALVPFAVPHSAFVSSAGMVHKGDKVHFDAPSQHELGRRYALAFLSLDPTWSAR